MTRARACRLAPRVRRAARDRGGFPSGEGAPSLRAITWFAVHRVPAERVMTDNGSAYRSHAFAALCARLAVRHLRTRAYTPRTNGKAERFIQTLLREWAYCRPYRSSARRRHALDPWLRYYNRRRPHMSLDYLPPISRLQETPA